MANTYSLISSSTLSSSAASVTFSSIPSTYTDLVLRVSMRSDAASGQEVIYINPNGLTTNQSSTVIEGNGTSGAGSNRTTKIETRGTGNTATSNTFSSSETYIPNYASATIHPISNFGAGENNNTAVVMNAVASLWNSATAITSFTITIGIGTNILTGSSFYLYGIKNS